MVARGGAINLVGALVNGLFQFLLVVAVTRALVRGEAGAFFEAIALFLILSNTCELGADTGLTRMIPRYRVKGRIADVRASLGVGIYPGLIAGIGVRGARICLRPADLASSSPTTARAMPPRLPATSG